MKFDSSVKKNIKYKVKHTKIISKIYLCFLIARYIIVNFSEIMKIFYKIFSFLMVFMVVRLIDFTISKKNIPHKTR